MLKYILLIIAMFTENAVSAIIEKGYENKIKVINISKKQDKRDIAFLVNIYPVDFEEASESVRKKQQGRVNEILDGENALKAKCANVIVLNLEYNYKDMKIKDNEKELNAFIDKVKQYKNVKLEVAAPFTALYNKPDIARDVGYSFEPARLNIHNLDKINNIINRLTETNLELDFQTCTSNFFEDYIVQNLEERNGNLTLKTYPGFLYTDNRAVSVRMDFYESIKNHNFQSIEEFIETKNKYEEYVKNISKQYWEIKNKNHKTPQEKNVIFSYNNLEKKEQKKRIDILVANPDLILLSQAAKDDKKIIFDYKGVLTPVITATAEELKENYVTSVKVVELKKTRTEQMPREKKEIENLEKINRQKSKTI